MNEFWHKLSVVEEITTQKQSGVVQDTNDRTMDSGCGSLWKKMIGKPYLGKPNGRFDEGEMEIEL